MWIKTSSGDLVNLSHANDVRVSAGIQPGDPYRVFAAFGVVDRLVAVCKTKSDAQDLIDELQSMLSGAAPVDVSRMML
jgi:hypothetical protein